MSDDKKNILQEADEITSGARAQSYGHPKDNFGRIARLWSAYLNVDVSPADTAMLMMLVKMARHQHAPKRDNLTDIAGYARTIEKLDE